MMVAVTKSVGGKRVSVEMSGCDVAGGDDVTLLFRDDDTELDEEELDEEGSDDEELGKGMNNSVPGCEGMVGDRTVEELENDDLSEDWEGTGKEGVADAGNGASVMGTSFSPNFGIGERRRGWQ